MALISAQSNASQNPLLHSPFRIDRIIASENIKLSSKKASKETFNKNIMADVKVSPSDDSLVEVANTFQPSKSMHTLSYSEMVLARYCETVKTLQEKMAIKFLNN